LGKDSVSESNDKINFVVAERRYLLGRRPKSSVSVSLVVDAGFVVAERRYLLGRRPKSSVSS